MKANERIYLSPPDLSGREAGYVMDAIRSNWIAPVGPDLDAFEKALAKRAGTDYAAGVSSCTAAIHLCLRCLGVEKGDAVFCSDLTFAGSCNPILYQNAEPVFIDSEPETWNISPAALKRALADARRRGRLPKAVIIVDLYGQAASYNELLGPCEDFGVPVIEDAAEALGAAYRGRPCGSFGRFGTYSFNGNKIVTTSGGGAVVSNDKAAIERVKFLATQAKLPLPYYEHDEVGYNYRLSNICAAIGRGQLEGLEQKVRRRREIFNTYRDGLAGLPVEMQPVNPDGAPNHWLSAILIGSASIDGASSVRPMDIISALERENIESRRVWKPMHMQPLYKDQPFYPHFESGKSVSAEIFENGVCLPSGSGMTPEQQQRVISSIKALF